MFFDRQLAIFNFQLIEPFTQVYEIMIFQFHDFPGIIEFDFIIAIRVEIAPFIPRPGIEPRGEPVEMSLSFGMDNIDAVFSSFIVTMSLYDRYSIIFIQFGTFL